MPKLGERRALALLLAATFGLRSAGADQPIVENYVGRQIPTAMVARNLGRGSGWLDPQLDTGPFPNRFVIEPPLFAGLAVGLRRLIGLDLASSGRIAAALATTLGAWGLYGLVRRRDGPGVAIASVFAFALLPVTLRYGRAFQPDALALGAVLAGLDLSEGEGRAGRALGWALLAIGLSQKVWYAFMLVPWWIVAAPRGRWRAVVLGLAALAPAIAWYAWAAWSTARGQAGGSTAGSDSASYWAGAIGPASWIEPSTWRHVARLLVRGFGPAGLALAIAGLGIGRRYPGRNRLWAAWAGAAGLTLAMLAGKLHHEYYGLVLAPPIAAWIGRSLATLRERRPGWAIAVASAFAASTIAATADTWQTPAEWRSLPLAAAALRREAPPGSLVVAPEALLFAADRRGCRLEPDRRSAERAAGEWGARLDDPGDPLALVRFYAGRGATTFADLTTTTGDPRREALHASVRRQCRVLVDRDGVLVADLRGLTAGEERASWRPPTAR